MKNKPVILFEGGDGTGKTTSMNYLKSYYEKTGESVHIVESISYHTFLESHDKTWFDLTNNNTRYMEYISWQVNNYYKNIKPYIGKELILIDRFLPSCYAYNPIDSDQYSTLFMRVMDEMLRQFFIPDVTFIFHVPQNILAERYQKTEQPEKMKNLNFINFVQEEYQRFYTVYGVQWNVNWIAGDDAIERTLVKMLTIIEKKEKII
jgi:thymidylate kinase